jgi:hypothetical protein
MVDVKQELIKLALTGNRNLIRKKLSGYNEAQRTELYPVVKYLKKILTQTNRIIEDTNSLEWKKCLSTYYQKLLGTDVAILTADEDEIQFSIKVITVACGPQKTLKYPFFIAEMNHINDLHYGFFFKVLADRDPPWLMDWLPLWYKFYPPMGGGWGIDWDDFWLLMKNGKRERPFHPLYPLYLDGRFPVTNNYDDIRDHDNIPFEDTLTQRLKRYSNLLEQDIWYLFRADVQGFNENYWAFSGGTRETWSQAFINLVDEGFVDRQKLLDETLTALTRPLRNTTLRYFCQFYDKLQATPEELNEGQNTLLDLLSSEKSHIVNYSLTKIRILAETGLLDWNKFYTCCHSIFSSQVSKNIKSVIALLKFSTNGNDTHTKDISLLLRNVEAPTNISLNKSFCTFLNQLNLLSVECSDTLLSETEITNEKSLFINPCLENYPTDHPGPGDSWKHAILKDAERILKIESNSDVDKQFKNEWTLIDTNDFRTSRTLDAISRLWHTHNVQKLGLNTTLNEHIFNNTIDGHSILFLVWHYGFPQVSQAVGDQYFTNQQSQSDDQFCNEIYCRLRRGESAPLLSLPSHKWGWVCASVLAERLNYYTNNDIEFPVVDYTKALYRLHSGQRQKALNTLKDNKSLAANFLRYALTGEAVTSSLASKYPQWWLGASRVHEPRGDLSHPESAHIKATGPHELYDYHYQWDPILDTTNSYASNAIKIAFRFPNVNSVRTSDHWLPTSHPNYALTSENDFRKQYGFYSETENLNRYANTRPIILDSYLHAAIRHFVYYYNESYDYAAKTVALLNPLYDPRQELTELAYILIILSLIGAHKKVRLTGTRLISNAIKEDRFNALLLGKTLARFYEIKGIKSNRLAQSLVEISESCPEYRYEIIETLSNLFEHFPKNNKPDHHLLSATVTICQANQQCLTSKSLETLSHIKFSGKSKLLLANIFELNKTCHCTNNIYAERRKQRAQTNLQQE